MNPEIIFENPDFLVINKPAGLMVHDDGKTKEKTLVDFLISNYPEIENVGEPMEVDGKILPRPGIVHRLDKETSGVMLVAKNEDSFYFLKNAFKDRLVDKTYHAFVWGNVKDDSGKIDAPIARSKNDFRKWSASRGVRGEKREAVTEYRVLSRFEEDGEKFTFIESRPKTGRTHQIRVHMKFINHPLVCDSLYNEKRPAVLGFYRLALHSRKISFTGQNGENYEFEAPYPDDFLEALVRTPIGL